MELANKLKCVNKINTNKMITLQSDASSNCMKLFNLIGNLESDYKNITKYFLNALMEDKATCIKTIFYARDKWGATTTFRYCLNLLGHLSPDLAGTIFDAVGKYGDYYDLYSFINTPHLPLYQPLKDTPIHWEKTSNLPLLYAERRFRLFQG